MALGAGTRDVLGMVLQQGLWLVAAGLAAGIVMAALMTRAISTLLFGVSATDPLTFAGVSLLLGSVALFATLLPARRAARVDPMVALRYE
jgi:ABC-type antimicrobial peptide transport system permease subunit